MMTLPRWGGEQAAATVQDGHRARGAFVGTQPANQRRVLAINQHFPLVAFSL